MWNGQDMKPLTLGLQHNFTSLQGFVSHSDCSRMPDDLRRSWKPGTSLLFWLTSPKKINCYCFWKLSSSAQNSNLSNYNFFNFYFWQRLESRGWWTLWFYCNCLKQPVQDNGRVLHSYVWESYKILKWEISTNLPELMKCNELAPPVWFNVTWISGNSLPMIGFPIILLRAQC